METDDLLSVHACIQIPVSYTHLLRDEGLLYDPELIYYGDWGRESGHTGAEAVSYTHLDVYKRQYWCRELCSDDPDCRRA